LTRSIRIAKAHPVATPVGLVAIITVASACVLFLGISVARAGDPQTCPSTAWCIWTGTNFNGNMYGYTPSQKGSNVWWNVPIDVADSAASLFNNRQHSTQFSWYENSSNPPPNTKDCQIPGGQRMNLGNWQYPDNNDELHDVYEADLLGSATTC
jgi:hypothetical protein